MKVSVWKNLKTHVADRELSDIILQIKNGTVKDEVIALRQLLFEGNKPQYDEQKKNLLSFTPSGTFNGRRKLIHLKEYNGCIILDIDNLAPVLLQQAEMQARECPYTYACFISPGAEGLKIIVRTNATPETHKDTFGALATFYENYLNIFVDQSGKDIPRLCLFSFHPHTYLNEESELFNPQNLIQMEARKLNNDPAALFQHCKRYTDKKKTYNEGNRNNYVHLLACNCNRRGLSEAETLYFICEEFYLPSEEIKATVASAYSNIAEHNTADFAEEKQNAPHIDKIEKFLSERYEFRFNEVTNKLEYRKKGNAFYIPITDFRENSLLRELKKAQVRCTGTTLRETLNSDFCPVYNPFITYFNSLPAWDGETDHLGALAKTVSTTRQELWEFCFRRWFIAMVACAIKDDIQNQTVIVFSGRQGVGKTTWMLNLVPQQLKEYCYSGTINPNNKDTLIHLAECLLINLDELENLNRSEIGTLKEIITKSQIRMRRAYGRNNETSPRRASFAGSVNTKQFLNDTTGSRRWLCFEVTEIKYNHNIDMAQVFAQALHLFKNGERFWFDREEINLINANNEQYQMKSVEEELLLTWFEKPKDPAQAQYLSTSEIATKLSSHVKINVSGSTINLLGKALHKHGYVRKKKSGRYVYEVRERSFDEVEQEAKDDEPEPPGYKEPEEESAPF